MEELFVFIRALETHRTHANQRLWGSAPNPGVYRIWANGSRESVPSPERGSHLGSLSHHPRLLGLLSSSALSVPAVCRTGTIRGADTSKIKHSSKKSTFAQINCVHFCSARYRSFWFSVFLPGGLGEGSLRDYYFLCGILKLDFEIGTLKLSGQPLARSSPAFRNQTSRTGGTNFPVDHGLVTFSRRKPLVPLPTGMLNWCWGGMPVSGTGSQLPDNSVVLESAP